LIPQDAVGTAKPLGRFGRWLGFGLTPLALWLVLGGLVLAVPAFWKWQRIEFMLGWDGLVLLLCLVDGWRLPSPESVRVSRRWLDSLQLGRAARVELGVRQESDGVLQVRVVDDLHPAIAGRPVEVKVEAFPREEVTAVVTVSPAERGDWAMGRVFLRYRGGMGLVERWAAALPVVGAWVGGGAREEAGPPALRKDDKSKGSGEDHARAQRVRVFPVHAEGVGSEFYLVRARQIELEKRKLRLRGVGREFKSLREYQPGDELRNLSWTATARAGHLVTRQFTVERSQQVWAVIDAGRLSRTAFELRRAGGVAWAETEAERDEAHTMTVTQLDQAASAAAMLAQVVNGSGDKFGMMTYGREVRQVLPPGAGPVHQRMLLDLLSGTKSEAAEADHLHAVARLKTLQKRRGLMVWVTELADSVGRPELVTAAADLARRHLVLLVLLKHPELEELAARVPTDRDEMFHAAAAQEMLERRREAVAQLERQGVLIVETTADAVGAAAVSKYLEVKAEGLL
jgi:uncharacterized protein (DUF58 family)